MSSVYEENLLELGPDAWDDSELIALWDAQVEGYKNSKAKKTSSSGPNSHSKKKAGNKKPSSTDEAEPQPASRHRAQSSLMRAVDQPLQHQQPQPQSQQQHHQGVPVNLHIAPESESERETPKPSRVKKSTKETKDSFPDPPSAKSAPKIKKKKSPITKPEDVQSQQHGQSTAMSPVYASSPHFYNPPPLPAPLAKSSTPHATFPYSSSSYQLHSTSHSTAPSYSTAPAYSSAPQYTASAHNFSSSIPSHPQLPLPSFQSFPNYPPSLPSHSTTSLLHSTSFPSLPHPIQIPPLPQHKDDDTALSELLLAWYWSGYHTGRYQASRTP